MKFEEQLKCHHCEGTLGVSKHDSEEKISAMLRVHRPVCPRWPKDVPITQIISFSNWEMGNMFQCKRGCVLLLPKPNTEVGRVAALTEHEKECKKKPEWDALDNALREERYAEEQNAQVFGFREDLQRVINKYSKENGSNTPDFMLADYLADCLTTFDKAVKARDQWYGIAPYPSQKG